MGVFGALCAIVCFLKSLDFGLLVIRAWAFVSRPDTFTFSSFVLQASGFYSFHSNRNLNLLHFVVHHSG
jgi:hypothetical protein